MSENPDLPSTVSTIVLGVDDLDASVGFYRDTLGLELTSRHPGLAFLSLGHLTLMLSQPLAQHIRPVAGAVEVVCPVPSVRRSRKQLEERGCRFLNELREVVSGSWATTLTDPDGHMLTLMGPE